MSLLLLSALIIKLCCFRSNEKLMPKMINIPKKLKLYMEAFMKKFIEFLDQKSLKLVK